MIEDRKCEGNAEALKFLDPIGCHGAGAVVECSGAGEEGSSMAIVAQAKQDEIKARPVVVGRREKLTQLLGIVLGGGISVQFCADTVNVLVGNRDFRQQRLAGHAKVAVRVLRRNVALVTEENMDSVPRQFLVLLRQQ